MPYFPFFRDAAGTVISGLSRQARRLGGGAGWIQLECFGARVRGRDPLTGLLGRAEFQRRVEARRQALQGAAVLLFDVDLLAALNHTIGHVAVDACLVEMARLVAHGADGGWVCRWGGDEFAVLVSDATQAERIAERIRASMAQSFQNERAAVIAEFPYNAQRAVLTFSVGAARFAPGLSLTQVLERCDQALDAAKLAGRNRLCWASLDLDHDLALGAAGLDIGQRLVGGLEREDLVDDGPDRALFDQAGDLLQLGTARLHEEEGIAQAQRAGPAPNA